MTRRELLKLSGTAAIAELVSSLLQGCGGVSSTETLPPNCGQLTDIQHVVIFIQENRSFDHYFGSYRAVRSFSDQGGNFEQPDIANANNPPLGKLLPFHLNTATTNAACTHDITHAWVPQHQSWNNGAMDGFVNSRLAIDSSAARLSHPDRTARSTSL